MSTTKPKPSSSTDNIDKPLYEQSDKRNVLISEVVIFTSVSTVLLYTISNIQSYSMTYAKENFIFKR